MDVLLKVLNQWQTFNFTQAVDGIDGQCSIYISCEEGKINLNKLYDFKEKKFVAQAPIQTKQLLQLMTEGLKGYFERAQQKPVALERALSRYFSKHPQPLDDVSQLLSVPEIAQVQEQFFMSPDTSDKLFLSDLFTVSTNEPTINPLLLSRAVSRVIGLRLLAGQNIEKPPVSLLVNLLKSPKIEWQESWGEPLAAILGMKYRAVPEPFRQLFTSRFEAKAFSVVSYGKVGSVTQKVCALIEKNKNAADKSHPFLLKKLYWL